MQAFSKRRAKSTHGRCVRGLLGRKGVLPPPPEPRFSAGTTLFESKLEINGTYRRAMYITTYVFQKRHRTVRFVWDPKQGNRRARQQVQSRCYSSSSKNLIEPASCGFISLVVTCSLPLCCSRWPFDETWGYDHVLSVGNTGLVCDWTGVSEDSLGMPTCALDICGGHNGGDTLPFEVKVGRTLKSRLVGCAAAQLQLQMHTAANRALRTRASRAHPLPGA